MCQVARSQHSISTSVQPATDSGLTRSELHAYQKPDLGRKYASNTSSSNPLMLSVHKDSRSATGGLSILRQSLDSACTNCWMLDYQANTKSKSLQSA